MALLYETKVQIKCHKLPTPTASCQSSCKQCAAGQHVIVSSVKKHYRGHEEKGTNKKSLCSRHEGAPYKSANRSTNHRNSAPMLQSKPFINLLPTLCVTNWHTTQHNCRKPCAPAQQSEATKLTLQSLLQQQSAKHTVNL